jgi:hypothetical protein
LLQLLLSFEIPETGTNAPERIGIFSKWLSLTMAFIKWPRIDYIIFLSLHVRREIKSNCFLVWLFSHPSLHAVA